MCSLTQISIGVSFICRWSTSLTCNLASWQRQWLTSQSSFFSLSLSSLSYTSPTDSRRSNWLRKRWETLQKTTTEYHDTRPANHVEAHGPFSVQEAIESICLGTPHLRLTCPDMEIQLTLKDHCQPKRLWVLRLENLGFTCLQVPSSRWTTTYQTMIWMEYVKLTSWTLVPLWHRHQSTSKTT